MINPTPRSATRRPLAFAALALLAVLLHAGAARAQWATSGTNISNTNTGNVGVGTATPAELFHVYSGTGTADTQLQAGSSASGFFTVWTGGSLILSNNRVPRTGGNFNAGAVGGQFIIGNTGDGNRGDFSFFSTSAGATPTVAELLRIKASGHVGIGTASPASIFTVALSNADYTNTGGAGSHLLLTNPNATGQNVVTSVINGATVAKWRTDYVGNISWVAGAAGKHDFYTGGDYPNGSVRMSILNNGNVGIGVANPTQKLQVDGNIEATGNIAAKYQDVAEWVPSTQKLAPGTVVTLDPARSNHVLASASAYDTMVAGVVSEQPGIILGEAGEGKVKVATTGRVKVKVDATKGPIRIGDLLVTSSVQGMAMRSEAVSLGGVLIHRPGTIIGKALEPLEQGVGEILVLLSMQ